MLPEISVIKSDSQYQDYLADVDRLVIADPDPDSADGKRLEVLALLVETYEKERFQIPNPTPVEAILFRLEQKGLQQKDLLPIIGSKSRVSEILTGKRRLTLPMVRRLSAHLEIPVSVLIGEEQERAESSDAGAPLQVVKEIVKRGWVGSSKTSTVTSKNASEFVTKLIEKLGPSQVGLAYLRSSLYAELNGPVNLGAVRLWLARVILKAREGSHSRVKYSAELLSEDTLRELARLSWFDNGPSLAREYLHKIGIAMVVERHLPGTGLDGAATLDSDGTPVIGLTLRHDRLDNFWFTLMHECAHILVHLRKPGDAFVDDTEKPFDLDAKEVEANRIARDILIPQHIWRQSEASRLKSIDSILRLANDMKVSPAIIAGRIRRESGNYKLFSALVGYKAVSKSLGVSKD